MLFPVAHHNPSPSTSTGFQAEQLPPEANLTKDVLSAQASEPLHSSNPLTTEPATDLMPYFARPAVRAVLARYAENEPFDHCGATTKAPRRTLPSAQSYGR